MKITDTHGRTFQITPVRGASMPQHRVEEGGAVVGAIFDEQFEDGTSLKRGRFAAWASITNTTTFHATIEEAATAIADNVPAS